MHSLQAGVTMRGHVYGNKETTHKEYLNISMTHNRKSIYGLFLLVYSWNVVYVL